MKKETEASTVSVENAANEYAKSKWNQAYVRGTSEGENSISDFIAGAKWAGQATPVKRDEGYNQECGLSFYEWQLEKVIDVVRELPTLEAIVFLKQFVQPTPATPAIDKSNEAIEALNFILANPFDVHIVEQKAKELLKLFTSQGGEKDKNKSNE